MLHEASLEKNVQLPADAVASKTGALCYLPDRRGASQAGQDIKHGPGLGLQVFLGYEIRATLAKCALPPNDLIRHLENAP